MPLLIYSRLASLATYTYTNIQVKGKRGGEEVDEEEEKGEEEEVIQVF